MITPPPSIFNKFRAYLLESLHPSARWVRLVLVGIIAFVGCFRFGIAYMNLGEPNIYKKDIIQEFLLARALHSEVNPLTPMPELVAKFVGEVPVNILNHPTPHPLFVGLVFYPIGWLDYKTVAYLWFGVETLLLAFISVLSVYWLKGKLNLSFTFLIFLIILGYYPIFYELSYGQINILILALLLVAFLCLQNDRQELAGVLLGFSMAIKLYTWPIMVLLLLKSNIKPLSIASATFLLANLLTILVFGFDKVCEYYLEVGPYVSSLHNSFAWNYSLSTIGWRLLAGTSSTIFDTFSAPPLVNAPWVAPIVSVLLPLLALLVGSFLISRIKPFDLAYGFTIVLCILLSPIVWQHYQVLLILPVIIYIKHLNGMSYPFKRTLWFLLILASLYLSYDANLISLIAWTTGMSPKELPGAIIPTASAMLSFIPIILITLLGVLLYYESTYAQLTYPNLWDNGGQKRSAM